MGNQELKQCPFCDCGAMMFHPGGIAVYRVECSRCGVTTFTYDTREKAVAAWNRRTIPAAAAAEQLKAKDEKIAELLANHAAINTVLDRLEPKIERAGEQAKDVVALLEAKDAEIERLDRVAEKYRQQRIVEEDRTEEMFNRAEKAEALAEKWNQELLAHAQTEHPHEYEELVEVLRREETLKTRVEELEANLQESYDIRTNDEIRHSKHNMDQYQELAELIGLPKLEENVSYGGGAIRSGIKELRFRAAELDEQIDTRQALDELKDERDALRGQFDDAARIATDNLDRAEKAEARFKELKEASSFIDGVDMMRDRALKVELERDELRGQVAAMREMVPSLLRRARDGRMRCDSVNPNNPDPIDMQKAERIIASGAGVPEAAIIKAAPDGLKEARDIIQRFYISAFGRAVRNWETYAPKLTAALEAVERMREGRS